MPIRCLSYSVLLALLVPTSTIAKPPAMPPELDRYIAKAVRDWGVPGLAVVIVKDESQARRVGPEHGVVVGTDGSEPADAAIRFAAARAFEASAGLEVVTSAGGHLVENVDEHELIAHATQIVEAAADAVRTRHPGLHVTTRVEDQAAEVSLIEASTGAGLVVVGTRGRGAFEGMLLGSVSHAVIHGADATVAVVDVGQV